MDDNSVETQLLSDVKRYDYDRWLLSLFCPGDKRFGVLAVLAFSTELSRIRETVSEAMLGDIRLQWWRDAIAEIKNGTTRKHPVAEALLQLTKDEKIDTDLMLEMIDARAKDLDPHPISTKGELLVYAEQTGGNLQRLVFQALGAQEDAEGIEAVMRSGRAYALTGILRAIPFHAQQDLVLLPEKVVQTHSGDFDSLFKTGNGQKLFACVEDIADLAELEFSAAFNQAIVAKPEPKQAVMLNALTGIYLKKLKKAGFDPASSLLDVGSVRKIMALTAYRFFG